MEESTVGRTIIMDNDRLFASDPTQRQIARRLYGEVKDLPKTARFPTPLRCS
jgi:hypothetical protein